MKPISTKTHGILDYVTSAALIALPRIFKWNKDTTRLLTATAVAHTGYSLLTDYELGVFKVIPMKTHLAIDSVASGLLGAAPLVFRNVGERTATAGLLALSIYEGLVVMNSESEPRRPFLKRLFSRR